MFIIMESKTEDSCSVGVAVRVRPLSTKEKLENPKICIKVDERLKMIYIDDRPFTFDLVYGMESGQEDIFEGCARNLVLTVFKGYNATILAYGQTGSGKTFTMGSGKLTHMSPEDVGIIPRVINLIFEEIERKKENGDFVVKINFIEIYNEEIHDLLNKTGVEKNLAIRERAGSIVIDGLCDEPVENAEGTLKCLEDGTLNRSVASTKMNSESSRSHAIFTINIDYLGHVSENEVTGEKWTTKFHFVDLAGSERAKKTGASGATFKEGISINKGLLCLGNVISALTEESKKSNHIPYRDSKLTRILQDSLGGNANTFMIACASPAESNFEETLNTLKYASRARNIKNKPVVNTDPHSAMIALLKGEISALKSEVLSYQTILSASGNSEMQAALEQLKQNSSLRTEQGEDLSVHKSQQQEKKVAMLASELDMVRSACLTLEIESLKIKKERDLFKVKLDDCLERLKLAGIQIPEDQEDEARSIKLVDEYLETIEKLKKDKEAQVVVIKELEYEYSKLMKEMERDRKLLEKKTAESVKGRESMKGRASMNIKEEISQSFEGNLQEYSRIFAESVFATISTTDSSEVEELDVPLEVIQELENQEENLIKQKEEIFVVEERVKEKEEKLKNIEGAFKEVQAKILEEMNQQYYKKIESIQNELKSIEQERDVALEKVKEKSSGEQKATADKFKLKIQELETQLSENIKKDKKLTAMHKELETQKTKLTKMNEEVKKEKKQKVDLQTKLKKEKEEFLKIKMLRAKEIMAMKKSTVKKDQEIKVLKSENRKKEIIAKRKTEELAAVQKRQRDIALKRKGSNALIDTETLESWVKEFAKACVEEQALSKLLSTEEQERVELEEDLQDMYSTYSVIKLKLDRNELILTDHEPSVDLDELYSKIQEGKLEAQEILDQIELLEEKVVHKQNKIIDLQAQLVNSRVEEIKSKAINLTSVENSQNLIKVLFDQILEKTSKLKMLKKNVAIKDSEIFDLREIIEQNNTEKDLIRRNFEEEIRVLQSEINEKKEYILKVLEESGKTEQDIFEVEELREENKKFRERLEHYVTRYNKLLKAYKDMKEGEYDKSKPRHSINSSSLTLARERKKKQKMSISEADTEEKLNPRISISFATRSSQSIKNNEEDAVFDRLQKPMTRSRTSIQPDYCFKPKQKWEQVSVTEAHEGSVTALMLTENMLYTGSNQKFKIWSLDTLACIGEVNAHNSFIKTFVFYPERGSFFTSCGAIVNLYDSLTLTKIASFKGHCDEIRTTRVHENYFICAGKANPGSITFWDMRKLDTPLCEKEKSLDIFSFLPIDGVFYYGCRDHKVHKMRITDLEPQKSLEPSHYDSVTCLAQYENVLISGSRDKNLRIWDYESSKEIKTVINAHTDWVNCIASDYFGRSFYTGGKDNKIKVWEGVDDDINLSGELSGHTSAITCLLAIPSASKSILSASADKTIRIWRQDEITEDSIY